MPTENKPPMSQAIIDLYDAHTHGRGSRRAFLDKLARIVGGAAAASALLPLLENNYARAAVVHPRDRRLQIDTARFNIDVVDMIEPERVGPSRAPNAGLAPTRALPFVTAYRARPKNVGDGAKPPAVIVIHENRGLNPHIEDVARRIALEGFVAYAVDILSSYGGSPDDPDKAREMIYKLDADKTVAKFAGVAADLAGLGSSSTAPRFAIGFCWGGGVVNRLAAAAPALGAGVAYYGRQASAEEAARIRAPLLLHYAGEDKRINAGIDAYRVALAAAGVDHTIHLYDGAQHAFNNDTNAARYNRQAADLAWSRTIAFLKEKLG